MYKMGLMYVCMHLYESVCIYEIYVKQFYDV